MAERVVAITEQEEVVFYCGRCGGEVLCGLGSLRKREYPPNSYCPQCGVRIDQSNQKRPARIQWE